jgi:hypothetical protein
MGGPDAPVQLFDQDQNDVAEENNVADKHPDIAAKIGDYLKTARTPARPNGSRTPGAWLS